MLPNFETATGYLPVGIHDAPWVEVVERFGWNRHRQSQIEALKDVLRALRKAGCMTVVLNGSFTTAKTLPGDFDLVYEARSVQPRLLPDWIHDPAIAGGDILPMHGDSVLGRAVLKVFMSDREGIEKGVVRIRLSSLDGAK